MTAEPPPGLQAELAAIATGERGAGPKPALARIFHLLPGALQQRHGGKLIAWLQLRILELVGEEQRDVPQLAVPAGPRGWSLIRDALALVGPDCIAGTTFAEDIAMIADVTVADVECAVGLGLIRISDGRVVGWSGGPARSERIADGIGSTPERIEL